MNIRTTNLTKSFGCKPVLTGINLQVGPGRALGITGPNGSGKSTLIRILCALLAPDAGEFTVDGVDPFSAPRRFRRRVGGLLHERMIYERLTARENLTYVHRLYGLRECDCDPDAWLERVGLSDSADRRVEDFSQGMKQRLALARALMHDSDLLLLDEPFASLDSDGVDMLAELLQERIAAGAAAVITSHQGELLARVASEVRSIRGGELG